MQGAALRLPVVHAGLILRVGRQEGVDFRAPGRGQLAVRIGMQIGFGDGGARAGDGMKVFVVHVISRDAAG
ncbi:hypothetical protein G6F56_014675 [Rhizopus delemar]|nr:hypothetical protein G6F40_018037 [Rhizopus arrhizus]KAG1167748.1 hypothetical protein G6F35_017631 [Rhizopus arrhizus]KAG1360437.1 hypothetical protein G6F60_015800 [Rhizopus arrhizus]KAG1432714.1 hypothetical protein G6F56_014675 [Rhizopus delemar]